ncbi:MAG: choice-of-anchor D domain-containing protein, partial [Chloroflexota bacterium]
RAYATNTAGTAYGGQVSFTTAPEPASVTTQAVSGIGINAATGNGTLTDLGAPNPTAHGMVWNTTGSPTLADASSDEGAATSTGAFTSTLSGLLPGTTYYVRAYATNAAGTAYGNEVSFTTQPPLLPSVTTQAATAVGMTDAVGNGTLTDLGVPNPTAHGMVWNTTGGPTLAGASSDEGAATSTGAFTSTLSGLLPGTTYYVRAYATNAAGTAYGNEVSFMTAPPISASVTTQAVSGIGINAATGNGTLTDLGAPNPTAHGMVWNTAGGPTLADASSDEGAATNTGAFTSTLSGLLPGTTYYVRAYATNAAGTAYGDVVTFTTATLPAEPAEMDVLGNGLSIASGSSTPSVSDGTDFSSVAVGMASITHTFTIRNTGDDVLALLGNPAVEITGTHAADFQVIVQPDVSVAADSSVTFAVIFTPSAAGLRTATISIASSDTDENPYTFVVQGAGFQAGYRIYLPVAMR